MLAEFLTILAGIIVIVTLSELIIKYSILLAQHYGMSGTFIGLTILSLGTSIPEIMTSLLGGIQILQDNTLRPTLSGLIVGANIGSDIFQQTLVLSIIAILGGIVVVRKNLNLEVGSLICASLMVLLFALDGNISRLEGLILMISYLGYLILIKQSKISQEISVSNNLSKKGIILSFSLIIFCFVIIGFMMQNILKAAVSLTGLLPVSASFLGIVMLGIASALPELSTSLIAVLKKKSDISAGILLGSGITNSLLALGLGSFISGYIMPKATLYYDLPFKIACAGLIYFFLSRDEKMDLKEAVILIALFFGYLIIRTIYFPADL
ncbi:MAG TPA: hypothetical protein VJC39_00025 [Candidatus Nanoarchaeia archaeon]|nr:hypothetical protein [Candidatus Nanoarchaeia archaeon]